MRALFWSTAQLSTVFFIWFVAGSVNQYIPFLLIPLTVFLFAKNERYTEIFLVFLFVLILSDNLETQTAFAQSFKNIYILILAAIFVLNKPLQSKLLAISRLFIPFFVAAVFCLLYSPVLNTAAQKTLSYILLFLV